MSLYERAKEAYLEYKDKEEAFEKKKREEFIERARIEFFKKFSAVPERVVVSDSDVIIVCDDLKFKARESKCPFFSDITFYLIRKCNRCGKEYASKFPAHSLIDIGRELVEGDVCDECWRWKE